MAPTSLTIVAIRQLARRRGYRVKKIRSRDWYFLESLIDGSTTVAHERAANPEDMYFSAVQLVEYLRGSEHVLVKS